MEYLEQFNDDILRIPAIYNANVPEEYRDNPLVSALLPMLSKNDFVDLVSYLPETSDAYRTRDAGNRIKKACELSKLVTPTTHFYELYSVMERMLFNSYSDRNPLKKKFKLNQYSLAIHKAIMDRAWRKTSGESFIFTGPSGLGKSTVITKVASCFPQVIFHTEFNGEAFVQAQLVWIKVKIPSDAARKNFSILFLREVDKCLGTTYAIDNKNTSVGNYEDLFRTIVSTYKLGMLIVDELQNLSVAKSGGDEVFLNFFSSLCDDLGVALVLVGTPNSTDVLSETFTATRRLTSGGDIHKDRFKKGDMNWKLLVSNLWKYQYVNTPKRLAKVVDKEIKILDESLFDEIYKLTQGIPSILTFLFIQAHIMAIEKPNQNNDEIINISQLRRAFNKGSQLIKQAVLAIEAGNLESYRDLMSLAERESSPKKLAYLQDVKMLLESKRITKQTAASLREIIKELDDGYILNKKERSIIKNARAKLKFIDIEGANTFDGECSEVKS
jgi:energy-coupling factor transporter ATP-binding protein EcfA2